MPPGRPYARWLLPPGLVSALAVVLSLGLHVPAYVGLGLLKDLLDVPPPPVPQAMEVEIVESGATAPSPPEEEAEPLEQPLEEEPPEEEEPAVARAEPEAPPRRREPEPEDEPEPEPEPVVVVAPPAPPPPPPEERRETSVSVRSPDPTVEPPPDARFLAEENARVEEETMARLRNPNLDDPEPDPGAPQEASEAPEEGNADEEEMAELQEAEGSDERDPTPEEVRDPPPPRPPRRPSRSPTPAVAEAARGDRRAGGAAEGGAPRESAGGGRQASGGGEIPMREVVVSDGTGSFTVLVPAERPEGSGEGDGGGAAVAARGRGTDGEGEAEGRAGRGRRTARGGGATGRGAPNLRVSWSDFASIYGEEELERQREAYAEQRRSRSRGASRAERWRRFRAAMENYDVRVRPGNQTALNTRADPFASYIHAMHNRIHPRFALGYLQRVPAGVDETYRTNEGMHTKFELAIDAQGRVDHVSIVATSGNTLFDLGAFEAVMGAQPFQAPPSTIASPDGLVYMHWSFYRNGRQCGTFNAQPFILAQAPGRREPDPLIDRGPAFDGRPPAEEEE